MTYNPALSALVAVTTKTADYTATTNDNIILCDASSQSVVITLPAASASTVGKQWNIIAIDTNSGTNSVSVAPAGADTLNTSSSGSTTTQWDSFIVTGSTSSGWHSVTPAQTA